MKCLKVIGMNKIDIEKVRRAIKSSSFSMRDISVILNISERNLYYKFQMDSLEIKELNTIIELLNLDLQDLIEK